MHVRDARAFHLLPLLKRYIGECEQFAAEYNLNESMQPDKDLMDSLLSPLSWTDFLGTKKFQKIRKILHKTTGCDIEHYRQLMPFLVVQQLSAKMLGEDESQPLDAWLWNYAQQAGKELTGLESFEGQLQYIRNIPIEKQLKILVDFARHPAAARKHHEHLIGLYWQQEIYRLHRSLKKKSGHFRKVLLYKRNFRMAETIETLCRQKTTFVAVGAGHLSGGKGLIRLLKQKGFRLRPAAPQSLLPAIE